MVFEISVTTHIIVTAIETTVNSELRLAPEVPVVTTPTPLMEINPELDLGISIEGSGSDVKVMEMVDQPGTAGNDLIEEAKADLANRLEIGVDEIEMIKYEEVIWRDSSLGCPQRGMQYLQVLMDGVRITLSDGEREYVYHSGENRSPFLCEPFAKLPIIKP